MTKRNITPEQKQDAARLKAIYESTKNEYKAQGKPLSQEIIAHHFNWTQGAVGHYLNGKIALNLDAAIKFAEFFDVPVADFSPSLARQLGGDNFDVVGVSNFKKAPILNYVQAGNFREYFDDAIVEEGYPYDAGEHGEYCFWVRIEGDSMEPDFKSGDMVLINTDRQPVAGNCVIALKDGCKETTFKRWRPRGFDEKTGTEYFQLVPSNENYPIIDSRFTPFSVCGVAVNHSKSLV
ncbi:LexA family protein [Psychrobacter pygoscelis]|uniref:LexA family protein n=1 Tax=Psychrobacter pygoscelis TaxID=2488563 RepID=UPI001040476A|nr:S24 family peptidase [Psychrobacter pygoscelis]